MATIARQSIGAKLINPTFSNAAEAGDKVLAGPGVFVEFANGSGGPIVVTLNDPTSASPVGAKTFDPDVEVTIPAGQRAVVAVGPRFSNPTDNGLASFTYDEHESLTLACFLL